MDKMTDYQKEMFYDIYKTSLGAILTHKKFSYGASKEQAVLDAIKIANASVNLLTDSNGLKEPPAIMGNIDNDWETIKRTLE